MYPIFVFVNGGQVYLLTIELNRRLATICVFTLLSPLLVAIWSVEVATKEVGPPLLTWIGFTSDGWWLFSTTVLPC
jgi:hypothetical protein